MLLVPYSDRMESLDKVFLLASACSAFVLPLLLSLNRSRSPCVDPDPAPPPAAACVGVLAELLELTLKEEENLRFTRSLQETHQRRQNSCFMSVDDVAAAHGGASSTRADKHPTTKRSPLKPFLVILLHKVFLLHFPPDLRAASEPGFKPL